MARRRFKPDGQDSALTNEPAPSQEGVFVGPLAPSSSEPEFDLTMTPPSPQPVPMPATETLLVPLEERLRRVEAALTKLAELQEPAAPSDRGVGQVTTRPGPPSMLSKAAALLPALSLVSRPASGATASTTGKIGLLWDMAAELQAIYYMYVDPRYRLSRFGRFMPLGLMALFLTSGWWMAFIGCGVGKFFVPLADLAICYVMFKLLNVEARRYRETAPDLPAHLRL